MSLRPAWITLKYCFVFFFKKKCAYVFWILKVYWCFESSRHSHSEVMVTDWSRACCAAEAFHPASLCQNVWVAFAGSHWVFPTVLAGALGPPWSASTELILYVTCRMSSHSKHQIATDRDWLHDYLFQGMHCLPGRVITWLLTSCFPSHLIFLSPGRLDWGWLDVILFPKIPSRKRDHCEYTHTCMHMYTTCLHTPPPTTTTKEVWFIIANILIH